MGSGTLGARAEVAILGAALELMGELLEAADPAILDRIEGEQLRSEALAVFLAGVDDVDVGDGRAVDHQTLEGYRRALEGALENAHMVKDAL
jgi:hypothetical protein